MSGGRRVLLLTKGRAAFPGNALLARYSPGFIEKSHKPVANAKAAPAAAARDRKGAIRASGRARKSPSRRRSSGTMAPTNRPTPKMCAASTSSQAVPEPRSSTAPGHAPIHSRSCTGAKASVRADPLGIHVELLAGDRDAHRLHVHLALVLVAVAQNQDRVARLGRGRG